MKRIFLSIAVVFLLVMTACGGAGKKESAENQGNEAPAQNQEAAKGDLEKSEYIVGLDDTFAPMGFRDDSGEIVGFDVDLAKECAAILGVQVKFQPVDWSMKENELAAKNIDFIWNGYSITDERKEKVAFSDPYLANRQIIVVMGDSPINSKKDLAGKTVTVQAESSALEAVKKDKEFMDSIKNSAPVEYPTNVECFADVEAGRSDAIVVDEVLAKYYMHQNKDKAYKILEDNFGDEQFAVGLRKDDTVLLEKLNGALKTLKDNGKYQEIYDKWFSATTK